MTIGRALAIVAMLSCAAPAARAQTIPQEITVDGTLTDDAGRPLEGETSLTLRLYESGRLVHDETDVVLVERGAFATSLSITPGLFRTGTDWELGVAVEDDAEMQPRIPILSVPFALETEHARTADRVGDLDVDAIQPRITGTCPAGQAIAAIEASGEVVCTLELQRRVFGACAAGEAIATIAADGAVTCAPIPTHESGPGISIAGPRIGVDTTYVQRRITGICPMGQSIRSIDAMGAVICERTFTPRVETVRFAERVTSFGTTTISLGSTTSRFCYLTSVTMRELDVAEDQAQCRVYSGSDALWHLESVLGTDPGSGGSTDAYVGCRAQCLSW